MSDTKICYHCKNEKPIVEFIKFKSGEYHSYCKSCNSEICKSHREKYKNAPKDHITSQICTKCKVEKPVSKFHRNPCQKSGYRNMCIDCTKITNKKRERKRKVGGYIEKETKICTACNKEHPVSNFSKQSCLPDGLNIYCKDCEKERRKASVELLKKNGYKEIENKKCSICEELKPISEFNKQCSSKDGHRPHCKMCQRIGEKQRINKRLLFGYTEISEKECTRCNQTKPINQFLPEKSHSTGHTSWCIDCLYTHNLEYRENHRDELSLYARNYRKENQEACNQWQREFRKTPEGKISAAINHHRRKTRLLNTPATLTLEQWLKIIGGQENECNICKKPFNDKRLPHRDHIIPLSKGGGLTFENVQALCKSCNSKKHNTLDKQNIVTWLHPQPTS